MSIPSAELRQCAGTVLPQLLAVLAACSPLKSPSYPTSRAMAPAPAPFPVGEEAVAAEGPSERPGLGTTWGEQMAAPITFTPFERATAQPQAELVLRYNDAEGVLAHARLQGAQLAPLELGAAEAGLSVSLVDDGGQALAGFTADGRALIMGEAGARYRIVVRNATPARFEIVASVDGLDVIDGKLADPARRGYLVAPYGALTIEGFRTSDQEIAAFRFGSVGESYAAQTSSDQHVGVIGPACFAERGARWTAAELRRRDAADPFPGRGYAVAPR